MAKFILAFLVAVCLAQGLSAYSAKQSSNRDIISDIIDKAIVAANNAIHEVHDNLAEIIEKSRVAVENAAANIIATVKVVVNEAIVSLESFAQGVSAKIDELLAEAAANGKDIAVCVEGKVSEAEKIQEDAITAIQEKCLAGAEQVEADIKATFEDVVQQVQAQLDVAENELLSCLPEAGGHHTLTEAQKIAACVVDEVKVLHDQDVALLNKIAEEVLAAEQKAEAAIQVAVDCAKAEEQAALDKEHVIIKEIEKCIAELP